VTPFWELLVDGSHITIAHAAREEFLFCYRAVGARPSRLFDVQLAAGFVGFDYPASYGNLISRLLNKTIDKGETRTDWKRRPLSQTQIDYALQDVIHLETLYRKLMSRLESMKRTGWLEEEITLWEDGLVKSETEPQWQRVTGITSLNRQALAIVREVWIWRDQEACRRDRSPKRILPDDLLVEVAKRGTADMKRLKAIRGMESRTSNGALQPIAEAVQRALELPKDQLPDRLPRTKAMSLGLLGQFLTTALNVVCRRSNIASSLVGTAQDVRKLAAWRLGMIELDDVPELAHGWRMEIVGQLIEKVLDGKIAIRVDDPKSEMPLIIETLD
jgi:ribonuclease D